MGERKSTTGILLVLVLKSLHGQEKKQPIVLVSSTKVEYKATARETCEAVQVVRI